MKIGFVILHYNTVRETKACVQSIFERIDTPDFEIVIVDNASPNGSGRELAAFYEGKEHVHVLLHSSNDGFARGNNVGYAYARNALQCAFICCLNNDTELISRDFCAEIEREYVRSAFAVCGPRIILRDGSDNYVYMQMPDRAELEDELREYRRMLRLMKVHLDHFVTAWKLLYDRILRLRGKKLRFRYENCYVFSGTEERHTGILLHGCCLIFSPVYIERFDTAFDPRTFLYREEEVLWLRCRKENLMTVYDPEIMIRHLEDAATNSIVRTKRETERNRLKNLADSIEVELAVLDEMGEKHA